MTERNKEPENISKKKDGVRILVVEDSATQAEYLKMVLEKNNYQVIIAKNGKEGLEKVHELKPTLVISDISMPVMDGYEMCRRIKDDQEISHIPVILLTVMADPEDIIQGLNAKADNYITKPYNEKQLLARIEHMLANLELRKLERVQMELQIFFMGETHIINSDRRQILDLLLATYENAVIQSRLLMQRTKELQKLTEQLTESNNMKDLLLDIITHDLKTPISVVSGMSESLLEEYPQIEMAQIIKNSADNILNVIDNAITLASLATGDQIAIEKMNLSKLIREVVLEFSTILEIKNMKLEVDIEEALYVKCHPIISEVLKNYISNAIKYAKHGKKIIIESREEKDFIIIGVRDFGTTIESEDYEVIFERRTQLGGEFTTGRGLGLAIVKRIADSLNVKVWASTNEPQGNIFYLKIPKAIKPDEVSEDHETKGSEEHSN